MPVARVRVSRTGKQSDFTTLTSRALGAVQSTQGVGGSVNICFGHVPVALGAVKWGMGLRGGGGSGMAIPGMAVINRIAFFNGRVIWLSNAYIKVLMSFISPSTRLFSENSSSTSYLI